MEEKERRDCLSKMRDDVRDLIFRLNDTANKRQSILDELWTLEFTTTKLRNELLIKIKEIEKLSRNGLHAVDLE